MACRVLAERASEAPQQLAITAEAGPATERDIEGTVAAIAEGRECVSHPVIAEDDDEVEDEEVQEVAVQDQEVQEVAVENEEIEGVPAEGRSAA